MSRVTEKKDLLRETLEKHLHIGADIKIVRGEKAGGEREEGRERDGERRDGRETDLIQENKQRSSCVLCVMLVGVIRKLK